jgi:hypothetical protein
MELTIVNADPRYAAVKLIEPTTLGYIHLAAEVRPRRLPFLSTGQEKSNLLRSLDERLPRLLWQQVSKKSFRNYTLANLEATRVGSVPIMYRLA